MMTEETFYIKSLRHPIVEISLRDHMPYTPLDVDTTQLLLYGTNASGKSTYMKSVMICIIMAQAGYFVPCQKMVYEPFEVLCSRMSTYDNIQTHQSSFTNELKDIRDILEKTGTSFSSRTFVFADELVKGTESVSAIVIMKSILEILIESKCFFL